MQTIYICKTCGTHYKPSETPPESCPICEDEKQYLPASGQAWLTYPELKTNHHNSIKLEEPNLFGIGVTPKIGIGQRALLLQTSQGNILWDCVPLLDDTSQRLLMEMGGLAAIAISHPHFYTGMALWSEAFGGVPIYIHEADRRWVAQESPHFHFWGGTQQPIMDGVTLINCGGHFPGSAVLHWQMGAEGRGVLLSGDTLQVISDRRYVSFMYSYPNLIPLPARTVQQIVDRLEPFPYDRIYGGWFDTVLPAKAKENTRFSASRYIQAIQG